MPLAALTFGLFRGQRQSSAVGFDRMCVGVLLIHCLKPFPA